MSFGTFGTWYCGLPRVPTSKTNPKQRYSGFRGYRDTLMTDNEKHLASDKGNLKMSTLLIERGADVEKRAGGGDLYFQSLFSNLR